MYGAVLIDTAGFELHQETVRWYLHITSTAMVILLYCQAHGINFTISVGVFYYRIECLYYISYSELSEIRKQLFLNFSLECTIRKVKTRRD